MGSNLESFDESMYLSPSLSNNISTNDCFYTIYPQINYDDKASKEIQKIKNYDTTLSMSSKPIFKTTNSKRGKQIRNSRKVEHTSHSLDNMLTKIQVHFFSFIIDIANDALFTEFQEINTNNFKGLNHKIKSKFNQFLFEKYKKYRIKDILELEISPKFKLSQIDHNKQLLNRVCTLSNWLDKFFDINYLKLFNYYYNNKKPLNSIFFEGKEIKLSKKTKSFFYLLEKNKNIKNELIKIAESYYYNEEDAFFYLDKKE